MRESRTLGLIVPNIESRFFPRLRFSSEMRQGRLLSTSESRTLGLIVPNIESRFFASLAGSLEKRCREDGYALFITSSGGSADDDLELLRQLVTRGVDGVFLVVGDEFSDDRALREEVSHLPIPAVMVDRAIEGLEMRQGRLLSTSETDEGESPTSWAICLRVTLLAISLLPGLRAISEENRKLIKEVAARNH